MGTVTFALHELGWSDFQSLCRTICREVLGQTVVGYLDSNDGGRDGAFTGVWEQSDNETFCGEFVMQAKHTTKRELTLGLADLADELGKAERLARAGRCDVYLLMTNARMTAQTEEMLHAELRERGIRQSRVLSSTWINGTIAENARLRMLVPRLYGLGDLTQILDERSYQQATAVLDSMRTDLAKLVRTTTYERAAAALENHGFVLLQGAPATGKTTIAGQLALAAADAYDTHVVMLEDTSQFADRWNPNERQLFWLDDAFGATQFDPFLANTWQRTTPKVKSAIDRGSKFVLTTRSYILRHAIRHLKAGTSPLLDRAQVIVDVADLTRDERHQILYNHLKHGRQPKTFLQALVPHLERAADHPGFTPELARRLADPAFTENLKRPTARNVCAFFASPKQFLADTLTGLDDDSFAALGLIFVGRGWLPSPIALNQSHEELLTRLGGSIASIGRALMHLEGSLVTNVIRDSQAGWVFAHPTMIDAYADQIRNPELLHLLIEGFDTDALLTRTTCGDAGFTNTIVLSQPLWPIVIDRLNESLADSETRWMKRDRCRSYLAKQCVPEFQRLYIETHPAILDELARPDIRLELDSGADLIATLHRHGVLPEQARANFARVLTDSCIHDADGAVLWDSRFRDMLTADEEQTLRTRLMAEVVPDPESILENFTAWFPADEDPAEFTQPIEEFVGGLIEEFEDDATVLAAAAALEEARWEWVREQGWSDEPTDDVRSYDLPRPTRPQTQRHRSVFDDLVGDLP